MPEVSRMLRSRHSDAFWRSNASPSGRSIGVCKYWMAQRYILDRKQPLRMVFSTDLTKPDTYLVSLTPPDWFPGCLTRVAVRFMPHGRRVVHTWLDDGLSEYLQRLRERWGQGRIAVWFEQDWQE